MALAERFRLVTRHKGSHRPGPGCREPCTSRDAGSRDHRKAIMDYSAISTAERDVSVALHEAAHAVTAVCLGIRVHRATLRDEGQRLGAVYFEARRSLVENRGRCSGRKMLNNF